MFPDLFAGVASDDYEGLFAALNAIPLDIDSLAQGLRILEDPKVQAAKEALSAAQKEKQDKSVISAAESLSPIVLVSGWVGGWVVASVIIHIDTSHPRDRSRRRRRRRRRKKKKRMMR